jgi:hypothetical protein
VHLETSKTKQCSRCKEVKLLNDFSRDRRQRDGLRASCKDCNNLRHKEYRQNNLERLSQYHKEYYQSNKDKSSQRKRKWYQNNRDKALLHVKEWRQNNRERILQQCKEYRQNNPDKIRAGEARRRATKRNATPPWADQIAINAIYAEALWLQDFTGEPCHVDHIVPLKSDFVCGLHVPANLQTLPGVENIAKSNRSWPGQLPCQARRGIDHQWWKELYARTIALEE